MSPYANSGMRWRECLEAAATIIPDAIEEMDAAVAQAERDATRGNGG